MTPMSRLSSLKWRLTATYAFLVVLTAAAISLILSYWTDVLVREMLEDRLAADAGMTIAELRDGGSADPQSVAKRVGDALDLRVTVIRRDGVVLADNRSDPRTMENHSNRSEFVQAIRDGRGSSVRFSKTLRTRLMYVAVSSPERDQVVRVSIPLSVEEGLLADVNRTFLIVALAAGLIVAWVSVRISRSVTSSLEKMNVFAATLASGEMRRRVYLGKGAPAEVAELAASLNDMAERLQAVVASLAEQKSRAETVLRKINDGVVVVDGDGRVVLANPAAEEILATEPGAMQGRTLIEATFNTELSELVSRTLELAQPGSLEVSLTRPDRRELSVFAAPTEDAEGRATGAVLVLHDLTPERFIERVRRDFVANVSHELRTPLAGIKALAETVVLRGQSDPKLARESAEKIAEEVDRLAQLTDELLQLAEIESGKRAPNIQTLDARRAAEDAFAVVAPLAESRAIAVRVDIPDGIRIAADPDGLKQMLVNLLDNAVKYTDPGGSVTITAEANDAVVAISVADTGIGISAEDQQRVFERFYRVDKDRSRLTGGTGLGLAIVKHLVESHGGRVALKSQPGRGSVFTLFLPSQPDSTVSSRSSAES